MNFFLRSNDVKGNACDAIAIESIVCIYKLMFNILNTWCQKDDFWLLYLIVMTIGVVCVQVFFFNATVLHDNDKNMKRILRSKNIQLIKMCAFLSPTKQPRIEWNILDQKTTRKATEERITFAIFLSCLKPCYYRCCLFSTLRLSIALIRWWNICGMTNYEHFKLFSIKMT